MWVLDAILLKGLPTKVRLIGFGLMGSLCGGGLYLARISNILSYASDDPKACINCHIMEPMYATWERSSHGRVASCNDCHVPHDSVIKKYAFKANDGLRHSLLFTLRKERQVFRPIPESAHVIQQNCVRCHDGTLDKLKLPGGHDLQRNCIDCHRDVPHGRVHGLSSTPNAIVPDQEPVVPPTLTPRSNTR